MADSLWNSVSLLLPFDGTDGATSCTDYSPKQKSLVFTGDTQLDTAQKKFGTASLLFDGTGDYAYLSDHADFAFGANDFTLECHARFASLASNHVFLSQRTSATSNFAFIWQWSGNALYFQYSTTGTSGNNISVAWTPSTDTWYHIAVARDGANLRFFVNGTQVGTTQNIGAATIYNSTQNVVLGGINWPVTVYYNGWMDNLRVTRSCRYTSNFEEPTAAFPLGPEAAASATASTSGVGFSDLSIGAGSVQATATVSATGLGIGAVGAATAAATVSGVSAAVAASIGTASGAATVSGSGYSAIPVTAQIEINRILPVQPGLPIHINRTAAVSTVTIPIEIGTYPVSASLPIYINPFTAVSTVSLPIHIYGDLSTYAAADFVVWRPKVILNGTDISSKLVGSGSAEFDEMGSPVATFSFLPAAGAVDPLSYVGNQVVISWQKYIGGTLTNTALMFTGIASDPTWDADERVLTISATGDMQAKYDRMTKAQIDAHLAAHSPQFSQYVFGDPADLSGWEYAEALTSTTNAVLWMDSAGRLRATSILAKASADYSFDDSSILAGSLGDSPQWPNRQEMVNQIVLSMEYRFVRRRQRNIKVKFRDYQYLETPSTYLSGNLGGWPLPQRTQVASAAESGGWTVIGDITYEEVWPSGTYPSYSDQGTAMYTGWANDPTVTDEFCIGAAWTAARRWKQTVTETATITVNATESQGVVGVLRDNESYSIEDPGDDEEWESSLDYTGYVSGAATMTNGIDRRSDLDTLRDTFEAAQEVAILKAKYDILRAHRGTTVTFAAPYLPALDLSHTVELDTSWLDCKGKVRRITHDWNIDDGGCTTTVDVALSRHNGAGLTEDTAVAAVEKADDPDETAPGTLLTFGMFIGGQDDRPLYSTVSDESGYFVNVPNPWLVWQRDPANPQVAPRIYEAGFAMKYPDIDASYANPSNAAQTAAIEVAIPEDTLVITSG